MTKYKNHPLFIQRQQEEADISKLRNFFSHFYGILTAAGIIPKLVVITADSIPEFFLGKLGVTWRALLSMPEPVRYFSIIAGILGTLSILPFAYNKSRKFTLYSDRWSLLVSIFFGVPSMSSVASGSRRAICEFLQLDPTLLENQAALLPGFLMGLSVGYDVLTQLRSHGRKDLRNFMRLFPRRSAELTAEGKRLLILHVLDDQSMRAGFLSDQKINRMLESADHGEWFSQAFMGEMAAYLRESTWKRGLYRAASIMRDYVVAPTTSGLIASNTYTYGCTLFSQLFSFINGANPLAVRICSNILAAGGSLAGFFFTLYALREHLFTPLLRTFFKDFTSLDTYKQLFFNLLLAVPSILVGLSNFSLARDNPDFSKLMGWLVGMSLVCNVAAVSSKGFSEWLFKFKSFEATSLADVKGQFDEFIEGLRKYICSLPAESSELEEVYQKFVETKLIAADLVVPKASIGSTTESSYLLGKAVVSV
ncbi:MAG: hypothetical protein K0S08_1830 [Gammaproteobacteria bacterium]|jgi:hypothetical protein|nr:hypothetical protein [Gammaproteobacteria bacterium]